jgi:hypothetical protein
MIVELNRELCLLIRNFSTGVASIRNCGLTYLRFLDCMILAWHGWSKCSLLDVSKCLKPCIAMSYAMLGSPSYDVHLAI